MGSAVTTSEPPAAGSHGGGRSRRRRWWLLGSAVVILVVGGLSLLVWTDTFETSVSPPLPPSPWVGAPHELHPVFDQRVTNGRGSTGRLGSYMQYDVGDAGQLVVETWYVGQELPATVPARPDSESARTGDSWDAVEVDRGQIIDDVEVECVRVVLTANGTPRADQDATAALSATIEERVAAWLADPNTGDVCAQVPWYGS